VLSVAGIRHTGTKVGYSNVSTTAAAISIAAPAGNCVNLNLYHPWTLPCLYSIETTSNAGSTVPGAPFYTYALMAPGYTGNILNEGTVGTSFAAPIVSGVAAMMIEANPNLTAAQVLTTMTAGTVHKPPGGVLDGSGHGTLDAQQAIRQAAAMSPPHAAPASLGALPRRQPAVPPVRSSASSVHAGPASRHCCPC
jgi:serine protease